MLNLEIGDIRALHRINLWARVPVLEACLRIEGLPPHPPDAPSSLQDKVLAIVSGCRELSEIRLPPAIPRDRADEAALVADLLARLAVRLQNLAGSKTAYCRIAPAAESQYTIAVEYEEESLARACLEASCDLCLGLLLDHPSDLKPAVERLREIADEECFGPSTRAIAEAARRRGIPMRRLNRGSLVQLGYGIRQRRIWAAETDRTGSIGEAIASNKQLTKQLLRAVGLPVPEGRRVTDEEDAWKAVCELNCPAVLKPVNGNHGRGVFLGLKEAEEVASAYKIAVDEGDGVLVERCIPGSEHRLLVVGDQMVAATRGDPVYVEGNSRDTLEQLVAELNRDPRRGDDRDCPLAPLEFGAANRAMLAQQGYAPDSVPPAGVHVLLQRNGNLATDVTDQVHPDNAATAVLAARTVGLDIAGIDMVAEDISIPLKLQKGAIVEVNAGPGLQAHLQPGSGLPRPVGAMIVEHVFPGGDDGRIPIVAVEGGPGSTDIAGCIARLLQAEGRRTGLATALGTYFDGQEMQSGACTSAQAAADLLLHPWIEAAVLETSRESIVSEGLGFEYCHVAVFADGNAIGRDEPPDPTGMGRVPVAGRALLKALTDRGIAVLSADSFAHAGIAGERGFEVLLFSSQPDHPELRMHRERGGLVVFRKENRVLAARGLDETPLGDPASRLAASEFAEQPLEIALAALSAFHATRIIAGNPAGF